MNYSITLNEFIFRKQRQFSGSSGEFSQLLASISLAAKMVHSKINCAGLMDLSGDSGVVNIQGESQQKLDLYANQKFKEALSHHGHVCGVLSEEDEQVSCFNRQGSSNQYIVALDPIDGSANIDVNIPVGTIFSIYRRLSSPDQAPLSSDFLQPGEVQVAAGYLLYGPSMMLVYTTGDGVNGFTYEPSIGEFFLTHEQLRFPPNGKIFSISEGYYADFSAQIRAYVDLCKSDNTRMGMPYTARYVGSLVADFHRNLLKGGIYLYPGYRGKESGKLRLLYECNPLAMLAEQAGGMAIDGTQRVLNIQPDDIHQRSPLIIGAKDMVEEFIASVAGA